MNNLAEFEKIRTFPADSGLYDLDCEFAILATLARHPYVLDSHNRYQENPLKEDDFYLPKHRAAFALWAELKNEHNGCNWELFNSKAEDRGVLNAIGGKSFIFKLFTYTYDTPVISSLYGMIEQIQDKANRRRLIQQCEAIASSAFTPNGKTADTLVLEASNAIDTVFNSVNNQRTSFGLTGAMATELSRLQESYINPEKAKSRYIPTGFSQLDSMLNGGLRRGTLNVIAARPGMGKTALGVNIITNIAMNENITKPVLFFSLEMKCDEIVLRQMTSFAKVTIPQIENNRMTKENWDQILLKQRKMLRYDTKGDPLEMFIIDDSSTLSPARLKTAIKRNIGTYGGVSAVLIDYVQLMEADKSFEYKHQELSDISRKLKDIANEFNIPIIALAQLNKAVDSRANKRPMPSDIGECDKIVHTADTIMLLHREELYTPNEENFGKATLILGKNRSGKNGDIQLNYTGQFFTFSDNYNQYNNTSNCGDDVVWA